MTEKLDYNALLLRILAHDILSPLTAIKLQTELLEKNFKKEIKEKNT
jgi:nitrogen fixation/metabolism regulation signal transduction histidine kinase